MSNIDCYNDIFGASDYSDPHIYADVNESFHGSRYEAYQAWEDAEIARLNNEQYNADGYGGYNSSEAWDSSVSFADTLPSFSPSKSEFYKINLVNTKKCEKSRINIETEIKDVFYRQKLADGNQVKKRILINKIGRILKKYADKIGGC